jgi:transcriptional antiterminator RfaH
MPTQSGGGSEPSTWAVVNTQPHRERLALSNLERQDFRVYCPMVLKRIRHARRTQDVSRPLFPGYLFVQVDPDLQRWRPILSTFGVRTIVRCGDRPSLLADAFIQGIKACEIDGAIVRPASPYTVGQQVRMATGPFDGLVATIIEMDEKDRLVVLMDLLSRPVKVRTEVRLVAAASRQG